MPTYEDVDPTFEYLDLSRRNLGVKGIVEILDDVEDDTLLKHLDLSYNVTSDETAKPSKMKQLFKSIARAFRKNRTLTALDLQGNHLFQNSIHALNEHLSNYLIDFTDALCKTNIRRINLGDNNMVGSGRMNKGLAYLVKKFVIPTALGLGCASNSLYSPSFVLMSTALHPTSSLTYLDLSDNKGGLNPNNVGDSEGIYALTRTMTTSLVLSHLLLNRNCLRDEDIIMIADSVALMPQMRVLGLGGNDCHALGAESVMHALLSHCALDGNMGLKELDLSSNPIGNSGIDHISHAIVRSQTLTSLNVSYCQINNDGIGVFQKALADNPFIVRLEAHNNPITPNNEIKTLAEAAVNRYMVDLDADEHAVDAATLKLVEYEALAKKLRFMQPEALKRLHKNSSFNVPLSFMQESLHLLQPPPRNQLIKVVADKDSAIETRLAQSAKISKKMFYARRIYFCVMKWYEVIRQRNMVKRALEEARKKREEENKHNDEDDLWGGFG